MKYVVSFSGGKDSLASLLWAYYDSGIPKEDLITIFCDTGWEHQLTYQHIDEVTSKLGIDLITLKSKKYDGMVDMAKKKGRFPSTKARFCTEELKVKPTIDFIIDELKTDFVMIQGIRADESTERSKMQASCRYFKHYTVPYKTKGKYDALIKKFKKGKYNEKDLLKVEKLIGNDKMNEKLFELSLLNVLPENQIPVYHTYRKKEVLKYESEYRSEVFRPFFEKTGEETIDYILKKDFKPNPLYYQGAKRVGCYPCIMCTKDEVKNMINYHPDYIDRVKKAEFEVGRIFFPPGYIPEKYMTGLDKKTGKKIPTMSDVENYVLDQNNNLELFEELKPENRSCMSYYSICE